MMAPKPASGTPGEQPHEGGSEFGMELAILTVRVSDTGAAKVVRLEWPLKAQIRVFLCEPRHAMTVQFGHLVAEHEVVDPLGPGDLEDRIAEQGEVGEELPSQ